MFQAASHVATGVTASTKGAVMRRIKQRSRGGHHHRAASFWEGRGASAGGGGGVLMVGSSGRDPHFNYCPVITMETNFSRLTALLPCRPGNLGHSAMTTKDISFHPHPHDDGQEKLAQFEEPDLILSIKP